MVLFFDLLLIIGGSYCAFYAYNIAFRPSGCPVSSLIQLVLYLFCCLPILLNYIFGIPTFETMYWWIPLGEAMRNELASIIYDVSILVSMLLLQFRVIKPNKNSFKKPSDASLGPLKFLITYKPLLWIFLISPIISIILTGTVSNYFTYGMSENRGLDTTTFSLFSMGNLLILSLLAFCLLFFNRRLRKRDLVFLILYSIALIWICGKRYIIADMAIMYLLFFARTKSFNPTICKWIKIAIPIAATVLICFSVFYLINFKESSLLSQKTFDSIYETLRVDFGRDGVIKFVIEKELLEFNHILDYPGQSFLSYFFIWIPRAIWVAKPYQHFEYLTGEILHLQPEQVQAGTTPSWFEMCIANLSWIGLIVSIIGIVFLCRQADKISSIGFQAICLILLTVLLTQGIDAYLVYYALFLLLSISSLAYRYDLINKLKRLGKRYIKNKE